MTWCNWHGMLNNVEPTQLRNRHIYWDVWKFNSLKWRGTDLFLTTYRQTSNKIIFHYSQPLLVYNYIYKYVINFVFYLLNDIEYLRVWSGWFVFFCCVPILSMLSSFSEQPSLHPKKWEVAKFTTKMLVLRFEFLNKLSKRF